MKYEDFITKILLEQGGIVVIAGKQKGYASDIDKLKQELKAKGYKFEPIPSNQSIKDLYSHDPINPAATVEEGEYYLNKGITRLMYAFPALNTFISMFEFIPNNPQFDTAAVDNEGHFYYNTDFLVALGKKSIGYISGLILHEIAHVAMEDVQEFLKYGETQDEFTRWNIASDFVNNFDILHDCKNMNRRRESLQHNQFVDIALPPGGCMTDENGIIDRVQILSDEYLIFPEDKRIDLNKKTTPEVYKMLGNIDQDVLDLMDQSRLDCHITGNNIYSEEIEEVPGGGSSGSGGAPTDIITVPSDLYGSLVIDKHSKRPGIIIHDDENTKNVKVVLLSDDEYYNILREGGIDPANIPVQL